MISPDLLPQIFSIDMKAIAGGFVTLASWIGSFAISYSFNFLMDWNPAGKVPYHC
jgi:SP family facilitated glucose transporter-like MFS transporter 8